MEIQDYPNYLIYDDGRVFSKKRNKFLKPVKNDGYNQIRLTKNSKTKKFSIHRLLAIHYIPNPENKKEVDHINRIRDDNRLSNLRWVTKSENQQNTIKRINNTSGHKNISFQKPVKRFLYEKKINKKIYQKTFKTLSDALCYKYIFNLKIRAGLI